MLLRSVSHETLRVEPWVVQEAVFNVNDACDDLMLLLMIYESCEIYIYIYVMFELMFAMILLYPVICLLPCCCLH